MKGKHYQRLTRAGPIISKLKGCSLLQLASSLEEIGIPTSLWVVEKMKHYIIEMYPDIDYDPKSRKFYVRE